MSLVATTLSLPVLRPLFFLRLLQSCSYTIARIAPLPFHCLGGMLPSPLSFADSDEIFKRQDMLLLLSLRAWPRYATRGI